MDVHLVLDGPQADVVRGSVGHATPDASPGEPDRVTPGVVIASLALLAHRHAAELAAPDDERVVEEPSLLQIAQERSDGPVGARTVHAVILQDVNVGIPAARVPGVKLHEAHAPLHHAPGEEATDAEVVRLLFADAVQAPGGLTLAIESDDVGRRALHAVGKLVGLWNVPSQK